MSDAQSEDTLDAMLVETICSDPMDVVALDGLVHRHGAELLQRCRRLTGNSDAADDLMQETWCRVLASRHRLDPDRGVAGYLWMTAKNLWRDWNRTARRGQGGSVRREQSLDASWSVTEQSGGALADVLPDPQTLDRDEHINSGMDLARGLAALPPRLREVIIARFHRGETAAHIARRYGRTQQTVTSWLRQGIRELRQMVE